MLNVPVSAQTSSYHMPRLAFFYGPAYKPPPCQSCIRQGRTPSTRSGLLLLSQSCHPQLPHSLMPLPANMPCLHADGGAEAAVSRRDAAPRPCHPARQHPAVPHTRALHAALCQGSTHGECCSVQLVGAILLVVLSCGLLWLLRPMLLL